MFPLTTPLLVPNLLLGGCLLLVAAVLVFKARRQPPALPADEKALEDTQGSSRNSSRLSPIPTTSEKDNGLRPMPVYPTHSVDPGAAKQTYEAFLVLDVEATCQPGTDFNYANEIIEWPVCLLRWKHQDEDGRASKLEVVDEFRSFVKPVWRPQLSSFCTALTGITQDNVDNAPSYATLVQTSFREFLVRNGLIDPVTGQHLVRFCWCSDGPWDIRDFVVKQCFISKIRLPTWISGDVMDVRRTVARWHEQNEARKRASGAVAFASSSGTFLPLTRQLHLLGLGPFEGRQHCGMDDTRNVARIVIDLARRGMPLRANTTINPYRRWSWMGKNGRVLEQYVCPATPAL